MVEQKSLSESVANNGTVQKPTEEIIPQTLREHMFFDLHDSKTILDERRLSPQPKPTSPKRDKVLLSTITFSGGDPSS